MYEKSERRRGRGLRKSLAVAATMSGIVMLAGCGSSSAGTAGGASGGSGGGSKAPYVLGAQLDLTGPSGPAGLPIRDGLLAAVNGINRRGGVNGHKLKLIIIDDASNSARAASAMRELAESDHASAILGLMTSPEVLADAPLAPRYKMALVALSPPGSMLVPPNPNVFGTTANLVSQGLAEVDYIHSLVTSGKLPAHPRVATIYYSTTDLSEVQKAVVQYATQLGMKVVASENPPLLQGAMGPTMSALGAAHPDAIISALAATDVLPGIKALSSSGLATSIPWANHSWGGGPKDLQTFAGLGATGYTNVINFNTSTSSAAGRQFAADVKADHANASTAGVDIGYAQVLLAAAVLARCGDTCPSDKFLATIPQIKTNLNGFAFAPMMFTSQNHGGVRSVRFGQWDSKTNSLVYVGPPVQLKTKP